LTVYLTRNGRGEYAIMKVKELDKLSVWHPYHYNEREIILSNYFPTLFIDDFLFHPG